MSQTNQPGSSVFLQHGIEQFLASIPLYNFPKQSKLVDGLKNHFALTAILTAAGLLSGIITICSFHFFGGMGNDYFSGGFFGAVLAGFLWLFKGLRSPWKVFLLLTTSIVSYRVASLLAWPIVPSIQGIPNFEYFVAGAVGAFLVLAATLFITFPVQKGWRVFALAVFFAIGGGLLGIVGWSLGNSLGKGIELILAPLNLTTNIAIPSGIDLNLYSVHLVWQAGISLLFGILFWRISSQNAVRSPKPSSVNPARLRISGIVFFSCMILLFSTELLGTLQNAFKCGLGACDI